ncbi:hypothetical protein LTR66_008065 [Elasticomyces elasticus]|nr:hypothetical protein LTR66_008065 [Elasticomyces elasticus]
MASIVRGITSCFSTPNQSSTALSSSAFTKAPDVRSLFPNTRPEVDGEDCLHDCETCTIHYPRKFEIDEEEKLYGTINGWSTHLIVATGKTDWVRDVADEKDSVMEAVGKATEPSNGKLMLSASNMPLPASASARVQRDAQDTPTTVLLLPAFTFVDNVTPAAVPQLIRDCINHAPTNTSALTFVISTSTQSGSATPEEVEDASGLVRTTSNSNPATNQGLLSPRPCTHTYLILLCSQATRDARCGQSAPLLRREFERHLRPLGLYRDLHDERPGGVGIYFISHVGGHKFSANVMIYRKAGAAGSKLEGEKVDEAAQCMWLARVRPEDCENIVRYTVLQGKVVKPDRQLRGGFDRARGLTSW